MKTFVLVFAFALLLGVAPIKAQQAEHPGIGLFKQQRYAEAIVSLRSAVKSREHKSDAAVWNALGLSYFARAEYPDAANALKRAVKLAPSEAAFHANLAYAYLRSRDLKRANTAANAALKIDPRLPTAYFVRATAAFYLGDLDRAQRDVESLLTVDAEHLAAYLLAANIQVALLSKATISSGGAFEAARENIDFLVRAKELLTEALGRAKDGAAKARIETELASITAFLDYFSKKPPGPVVPDPDVVPYRILSKPRANYTDYARTNNVQGRIRMAILLGASGKVEGILLLTRLGYGLDENAVAAARKIQFEPQKKDGKPVSKVVMFEYGFDID